MIVEVKPFLLFAGDCARALELYEQVFDSQIIRKMSFGECMGEEAVPADVAEKIAFSTFRIGNLVIAAGDTVLDDTFKLGTNVALLLELESQVVIESMYNQLLANQSNVIVELGKTAWSQLYAKVQDQYGAMWELNFQGSLS